jgi:putative transposase
MKTEAWLFRAFFYTAQHRYPEYYISYVEYINKKLFLPALLLRGRALDNIFVERLWRTVKYEDVYLKKHDSLQSLLMGLTQYFLFYNEARWHQSLNYKAPNDVHQMAMGSGAKIMGKFNEMGKTFNPVKKNWDSALQLECEQGSILN